jgi:thiol-disulfide isomerase/thioredoxin
MGKATRIKQQNARNKIAAQRAAARRADVRNRVLIAGGSVVVVLAIVLALILVKAFNKPGSSASGSGGVTGTALSASAARDVTSVSASTLNTVGVGSVPSFMAASEGGSPPITPISGSPPLTSGGKPEMLYIGAEYCPFCAAERWAMAIALSRFGTLSPLHGIHSSSTDTDPNTPTLTFYQSTYSSPYLAFTPVENETVNRTLLQNTTAAQMALWQKYDSSSGSVGYPFIDFGNKYVIKLPSFDPAVLAGMTWSQVAAALHNPSSSVAQGADGAANLITAAICKMTNGQPGSVCTAPGVVTASKSL